MIASFKSFLFDELGLSPDHKFLLAVSGGMDSMCMWELFRRSELNYIILHCNFKLRGDDSEADERFILEHALPEEKVMVKSFNTDAYAKENSVSIQMAARELRYEWFNEVKEQENCNYIATAHHLDDQIETFFIQLLRKNNLPGLSGMPVKTDKIVRPMMFVGRESIQTYVDDNNIPYREDKSNASDIYLRNKIRRNLIPIMQKVLPDFKKSILELMGNMKQISSSMEAYFDRKKKDIVTEEGETMRISIEPLKSMDFPIIFLETLLKPKGFTQTAIRNLHESLESTSGKTFFSDSHKMVKDRSEIIVVPNAELEKIQIEADKMELTDGVVSFIEAEFILNSEVVWEKSTETNAMIDFDRLDDKIIFRKWEKGDYFYPLGMGGKKKLSDFFVDRKMTILEKEEQWIMLSGDEICWIVGRAIDDRFKIRENTKVVLHLEKV